LFTGSEFLGAIINVRHAAKKPPGQQQQKPRGKGEPKPFEKVTKCVLYYISLTLDLSPSRV